MLTIEHVTKKYGDITILDDACYTFPAKGLVCLMGPSGSGKTTLLNLAAGFDSEYEGKIYSCGRELSELDRDGLCAYRRDCVGFVFQNYHLLPGYSVLENVLTSAELLPEGREESVSRAEKLLERLGLLEKTGQKVENLSGGQKQRTAIARALMGEPQLILADEPTGALDRKTSGEIMTLLKELSEDRLVLVITHDARVCEFADEVIHIRDKKIAAERKVPDGEREADNSAGDRTGEPMRRTGADASNPRKRAGLNFGIRLLRYAAVAAAISAGILAFLFSLSFGNVMEREIEAFKEKNTVFNNGYIRGADDGTILGFLQEEERIENVYYQYPLHEVSIESESHAEVLAEKLPLPKTTESLSYGVMPGRGKNEIALTPSLAKKFALDIKSLLGQTLKLSVDGTDYMLTVSGIYNAGYDDFFVSSDVEEAMYAKLPEQDNYSISYDVAEFEDVVTVNNRLELCGIHAKNAVAEVFAMQQSFRSLGRLFRVISVLVLFLALFLCVIILVKLQNSRYRELGLLSALGFRPTYIRSMIRWENIQLSVFCAAATAILFGIAAFVCGLLDFPLKVGVIELIACIGASFAVIIGISTLASIKLIRTEPAEALRHR